ncbi:MAG: GAF domain-containing protein, partial [Bacteroidota bacterium]
MDDTTRSFHIKVQEEAHSISKYFVWGYLVTGLALSPIYQTYVPTLIFGVTNTLCFYGIHILGKGKFWPKIVTGLLLWNFNVLFIIQMQGALEIHFFYFITITALLFYESWKVILPTVVYALVSFTLLFYFSAKDLYFSLDEISDLTAQNIMIHLFLAGLYGAIACIWSTIQRKQTEQSALDQLKMREQIKLMENNVEFAREISQGNLQSEYEAQKDDRLGYALIDMRKSLLDASERESKEKFINVGLASVGEILRNHSDNLDNLCDQVIGELVSYMKANQGGIFVMVEDTDDQPYLELKACRAYERRKFLEKKVEIGQGLVGQAAIEKRTIYMTNIPEDYLNITSGLGLASPSSLLIVPLKTDDKIMGVIEIASFEI